MTKTVGVAITGRVQGVGYRAWCQTEAMSLGLDGWVRNRRDGRVEAVFAGSADGVANMLGRVWRGPPGAEISSVAPLEIALPPGNGFRILPTV